MTAQLSAYVDAICDGANEPVDVAQRTAWLASFTTEFPHLSALLGGYRVA
jgi:hypothetical protein